MQNNITLKLIAQRRALGLNMSELAALPSISQSKQTIADYESGRRSPAASYIDSMELISSHYRLLLRLITNDITRFNTAHPLPITSDLKEYEELLANTEQLNIPFFRDFKRFVEVTSNTDRSYWRVWQAVIGHLLLEGVLNRTDDYNLSSLSGFGDTQYWLDGGYRLIDEDATNNVENEKQGIL